jgi:RecQ family ATP-dependent DNA helicase
MNERARKLIDALNANLKFYWGYDSFRPGQLEAILPLIAKVDSVTVMPTGGGKSLLYQVPVTVMQGTAIIISPLIALMRDQVEALKEKGYRAETVNSNTSRDDAVRIMNEFSEGLLHLLYVSPEKALSPTFLQTVQTLKIAYIAVDEAHCISQWGHDFRPKYRELRQVIQLAGRPPVMAVTATATPAVRDDIIKYLGLKQPRVTVGGFNRPNIQIEVRRTQSVAKMQEVARIARQYKGQTGIVYVLRRDDTRDIANWLRWEEIPAYSYNGGMDKATREQNQNAWMQNGGVMVATNAFGMGVDKPDVRWVCHFSAPGQVEAWVQEIGRAGRDGKPSVAITLWDMVEDESFHEWTIDQGRVTPEVALEAYASFVRLADNGKLAIKSKEFGESLRLPHGSPEPRAILNFLKSSGVINELGMGKQWIYVYRDNLTGNTQKAYVQCFDEFKRQEAIRDYKRSRLAEMWKLLGDGLCYRREILRYFGELDWHSPPFITEKCCNGNHTAQHPHTDHPVRANL